MVLWPLGGFVICGPVESVVGDFKVAIAGPLTHIPQMLVWVGIFAAIEGGDFTNFTRYLDTANVSLGALICAQAFYLNMVLFLFNLFVPAYPLDGGRCLAAGLILCGLKVLRAAKATAVIGMTIAGIMIGWGLFDFFNGASTGLFTALIGLWIFMTSFGLFKLTQDDDRMSAADKLRQHPVFGQNCYQDRARQERAAAQNNNSGSNNV